MKIVLVSHQFLPDYSSGTEVLTLGTARALRTQGHDVAVFTSCPSRPDGGRTVDYMYDGFNVRQYIPKLAGRRDGAYDAARHEYYDRDLGQLFEAYLDENRPDVVHFFHLMRLTTSALQAAERKGVATVFTPTDFWAVCPAAQLRLPDHSVCAGPDPDGVNCVKHMLRTIRPAKRLRFLGLLSNPALRRVLNLLDKSPLKFWRPVVNLRSIRQRFNHVHQVLDGVGRIIVPSKLVFETLERYGYRNGQMVLSRYGLAGVQDYPAHRPMSISDGPVIGFIGTLAEHKGAHILLRAVATLPAELRFSVQIYGGKRVNEKYSDLLCELAGADSRITFYDEFPNDRIGEVLAGIDALCIPSIWLENIPLVLLSAQAAKVPVIASDVGGISELIVDGQNGLLFPPGDHLALACIIRKLVNDPALVSDLAAHAEPPKFIEEYASECVSEYAIAIAAKLKP
ncbi:MAG: glycosyltransferase family 4 protein [Acidobacteria bacterium]|nr:glycosyltransferase family 4 protein [Acidobacteriota bacterium]